MKVPQRVRLGLPINRNLEERCRQLLAVLIGRYRVQGSAIIEYNWVSGFGFRVSGFGFRNSGFGFEVSGSGIRDPGSGIRDPGFRISGFGFRISGSGVRVSGFGFRMEKQGRWVSGYHMRDMDVRPNPLRHWYRTQHLLPSSLLPHHLRVEGSGLKVQGLGLRVNDEVQRCCPVNSTDPKTQLCQESPGQQRSPSLSRGRRPPLRRR